MKKVVLAGALALGGCEPKLGDEPFLCEATGACPDGFECRSGVCVVKGATTPSARVKRVEWINAGEMFWLSSDAGTSLVVNDGFTGGSQGVYRIDVAPDGTASEPEVLLAYEDVFPRSSGAALLDDGRVGLAMLRFPQADSDNLELSLLAIDPGSGTVETLYEAQEPYLGGFEPAYVSLVAGIGTIDVGWTKPGAGGKAEVIHLERQGSTFTAKTHEVALDPSVLPLSGDCLLWPLDSGALGMRVGFESFAVAKVAIAAGQPTIGAFQPLDSLPLWAFDDALVALEYGAETASGYEVSLGLIDWDGASLASSPVGELASDVDLFSGARSGARVLVAPLPVPDDPTAVGVGEVDAAGAFSMVATVPRAGDNAFYSARAFEKEGVVYVAWTEFQDASMDLWVGATQRAP